MEYGQWQCRAWWVPPCQACRAQNRFWAEYGGSAGLAGFVSILGGDHDFSQYGVRNACEAGRSAVVKHFEHIEKAVPKLRAAA